jgi:hypothetical protein
VKILGIILALVGLAWLWKRSSASKSDRPSIAVPEGTSIGQIGARVENPAALEDFAEALRVSNQARVISVVPFGTDSFRLTWTDGRITYQDRQGNVFYERFFTPSP